jgi:putative ABC transport system permease protein
VQPQTVIGTRSEALSSAEVDALQARNESGGALGVFVETGPAETPATAAPTIFVPAKILALAASLIALGLSRYERRRDEATLAALGAPRRLLRRIGAWEALIVTGTGALAGTLAGSALVIGFARLGGAMDPLSMAWPWLWIGAFAVGLPAVMTFVGWLVPPRHSDLTRRTAIA